MVRLLTTLIFLPILLQAQEVQDSVRTLNEVVVKAYASDRPLMQVPAAVGYLDNQSLERFSNTSLLPAVNLVPGVRMEERSPGSYRFAIRGSSLRSPFGVRNVKVYWNGLPFTDGGGNTYLNLLDYNAIGSAEIIKGPGSSLYGAGTGGVILLNDAIRREKKIELSALGGSYGLQRYQVAAQTNTEKINARVRYAHQQADGYREQTKMRRDAVNADVAFAVGSTGILTATLLYSDLMYQTPGGLTKVQYDADPRQARPATPTLPGAVEAKAAVYNKTFFGGLSFEKNWNTHWSTRVGWYGSHSQFENPTVRNYEQRKEDNTGGRLDNQYKWERKNWGGKITFGGEFQYFVSPVEVYNNDQGSIGTIQQSNDILKSELLLTFAQAEIDLPKGLLLTIGGSGNFIHYDFESRPVNAAAVFQSSDFNPVFSPRLALLKKLTPSLSIYGSASRGFSPPTLAEVRPSTNNINTALRPEQGTSYEAGFRGHIHSLAFDLAAYNFQVTDAIVIQRTPDGAEYFVNAGGTSQRGLETSVSWTALSNQTGFISDLSIRGSYSFNYYHFKDYVQDGNDYSGNQLTGVAPDFSSLILDVKIKTGSYLNVTGNYVDHTPLNDGNTQYAADFFLLGARAGHAWTLAKKVPLEVFAGIDNALDRKYSLGNDLNAAGGRYYNAAPARNYFGGVKVIFK